MADNVTIKATDDTIWISSPYKASGACKALPGRQWHPEEKLWSVPATPQNAYCVALALSQFDIQGDDAYLELRAAGMEYLNAQIHKRPVGAGLPLPPTATTTPWPHQTEFFWWADKREGSMGAMGMGCGKTYTAKMLCDHWSVRRLLIVCPLKIAENRVWPTDWTKHGGKQYQFHHLDTGSTAENYRVLEQAARNQEYVVVVNYDSIWRDEIFKGLMSITWDAVIYDEAHRLKSHNSKASMAAAKLQNVCRRRLMLTGTPFAHGPLDIFAQARALDPNVFGWSWVSFRQRYGVMDPTNKFVTGYQNLPELQAKFFSFAFHVDRRVLKLPGIMHERIEFELSPAGRKAYRDIHNHFIAEVKGGVVVTSNALTKVLTLQRITSGWVELESGELHHVDSEKAKMFEETLEDIGHDEPVVVFARFHKDLDDIRAVCEKLGYSYSEISGRENGFLEWQGGKTKVLVAQIQAAREGLDMTRAAYGIYYSLTYSLSEYDQSEARLYRPGQGRSVTCYHLVARGTVDEKIYDALQNKREIIQAVLATAYTV